MDRTTYIVHHNQEKQSFINFSDFACSNALFKHLAFKTSANISISRSEYSKLVTIVLLT